MYVVSVIITKTHIYIVSIVQLFLTPSSAADKLQLYFPGLNVFVFDHLEFQEIPLETVRVRNCRHAPYFTGYLERVSVRTPAFSTFPL